MTYKVIGWVHNFSTGEEKTEASPVRPNLMAALETLHGLGNVASISGLMVYQFNNQPRVRFMIAQDGTAFGVLWVDEVAS